jgi:hypothetical protein
VLVRLGKKERRTAGARGLDDIPDEETFDLMVGGSMIDAGLSIDVEVWDYHWISVSPEVRHASVPLHGAKPCVPAL